MKTNLNTEYARKCLPNKLDSCRIAMKLGQQENERVFCIHAAKYLEALKRSHNANECALAARIDRFLYDRDYDAAIQALEGRR